jgi:hypothetical protein
MQAVAEEQQHQELLVPIDLAVLRTQVGVEQDQLSLEQLIQAVEAVQVHIKTTTELAEQVAVDVEQDHTQIALLEQMV